MIRETRRPTARGALSRGLALGSAASILALSGVMAAGAAANAADSVSPNSGTVSGGTSTQTTIPMLTGQLTGTATDGGTVVLGSDGFAYVAKTGKLTSAPAGVRFTSVSGINVSGGATFLGIGTDNAPYYSPAGSSSFTKVSIPTTAKATAAGEFILGANGKIYDGKNGSALTSPAGVTFTSISAGYNSGRPLLAIGSDGTPYYSAPGSTSFKKVSIPTTATATTAGEFILGANGTIYDNDGTASSPLPGVTFTSTSASRVASGRPQLAIASNGSAYYSAPHSSFTKMSLPVAPKSTSGGRVILGVDGKVYNTSGTAMAAPAGVTFASVSAGPNPAGSNDWSAVALDSNGVSYYSTNGGAFSPTPPSKAQTVSGVSFGSTAAKSFSQSGATMNAVTPSHAAGPVDVVVTTTSGSVYTLPQAFTYTAPAAPSNLSAAGPDASGASTLSGVGDPAGTVTVKDANGNVVGTATPAADGTWSVTVPAGTATPLSITQTVNGSTSAPVTYDEAPLPVVAPAVGASAAVLALLGVGVTVMIRRRKAAVAA